MSTTAAAPPPRRLARRPPASKKSSSAAAPAGDGKPSSPRKSSSGGGERTVKKLRLSKALTIPEATIVSDACRRMAARRVDAVLLTDANGLLSGIVTDKDIATRVIGEGLRPDQTAMSKIMTRNPFFVTTDLLAIDALKRMVEGKFRHLPVVENGEVIAMLDITKCLDEAISRMEKAAEQGSAIAAAVEGVERQWGSTMSGPYAFIDLLRERAFKPSLSTILSENTKVATLLPSDPVYLATKRMKEMRTNSVIVVNGSQPIGILTSKDVIMRVVAQNLSPELTLVEKVMTPNPECASVDTSILDALHLMHDGRFLHLPVLDRDGSVVACVDVLQITNAALSMAEGGSDAANEVASNLMQKFWDSAITLDPPDDEFDTRSEKSTLITSDGTNGVKSMYPSLNQSNTFAFKFEDGEGYVHRFVCEADKLSEIVAAVTQRLGQDNDRTPLQLLYEDDEGDKVLLSSDSDLVGAVNHARSAGWKVLRLYLESPHSNEKAETPLSSATLHSRQVRALKVGVLLGAAAVTGIAVLVYLKRSQFR